MKLLDSRSRSAPAGQTRRSLFSLIAAPFLPSAGLLTTSFGTPASDPLAEAALAVDEAAGYVLEVPRVFALVRRDVCPYQGLDIHAVEHRQLAYAHKLLAKAEAALDPLLDPLSGVAVVAGGRVYAARGAGRTPSLVKPVWVALLVPAGEGGAL